MLKLLGLTSVMIAALMTGFIMAKELNERTKTLKEIRQAAIHIKSDLEYRAPDIEECFRNRGRLFSKAARYIKDDELEPAAALKKACNDMEFLRKEDKEIIYSYANNLFLEDIGGQIANVSWLIDNIGLKAKEAEAEYQTKNRLYKGGGALAGIGFVILLI